MLIIGSNLTTMCLGVAFFVSVLLRIYRIYGIYQLSFIGFGILGIIFSNIVFIPLCLCCHSRVTVTGVLDLLSVSCMSLI